jgi:hypothetical protein
VSGNRVRRVFTALLYSTFFGFLIWLVVLGVRTSASFLAPAGDTLAECLPEIPDPLPTSFTHTENGRKYLVLIPDTPTFPGRSGPPMYIFDDNGRLVDWVVDSGSGSWYARFPGLGHGRRITREELMRWPGATR